MSLNNWKSDEKLVNRISQSIKAGNISHAYIFEGDSCVDKEAFAVDFLKAVCCEEAVGIGCDSCASCRKLEHDNCEDLYIVRAEASSAKAQIKSVRDEAISKLQQNLAKKPIEKRSMAIICDADTMTVRAQNRFLKTLEEPAPGTVIVLLSENRENLLDTIKSRCISYRINGDDGGGNSKLLGAESLVDALIEGDKFFNLKKLLSHHVKKREDAFLLLDGMERIYLNMLLEKDERSRLFRPENLIENIMLVEEARRDLMANVNYMNALKNMMLKIGD